MSSSSLGDKYTIELEVNGAFMKLGMAHTLLCCQKEFFPLLEKHRLGYWVVNLPLIVKELSAAPTAIKEAEPHQCAKAEQGDRTLKSKIYFRDSTLKKY